MVSKSAGVMMLWAATFIWGASFVAQSIGSDYVGPFTFNGVRFLMGAAVLLPAVLRRRASAGVGSDTVKGGIICGLVLFTALSFQQSGIVDTTAGKAGFITSLNIVMVPVLGLCAGRRVRPIIWGCILAALFGMYLLCVDESITLGRGEIMVLVCALFIAVHIMVIDFFSPKSDGLMLSFIQFMVCGFLGTAGAFIFENPSAEAITGAAWPLLYAGIMSSGVAYTLQTFGQRSVSPVTTSLIMSMEAVFSIVCGWFVLGEILTVREMTGCAVMLAAILASQLLDAPKGAC